MANEATDYDARQACKFSGLTDEQRSAELVEWCTTKDHALVMAESLRRRLNNHREDLKEAQEFIAAELDALNAVQRLMYAEGWLP